MMHFGYALPPMDWGWQLGRLMNHAHCHTHRDGIHCQRFASAPRCASALIELQSWVDLSEIHFWSHDHVNVTAAKEEVSRVWICKVVFVFFRRQLNNYNDFIASLWVVVSIVLFYFLCLWQDLGFIFRAQCIKLRKNRSRIILCRLEYETNMSNNHKNKIFKSNVAPISATKEPTCSIICNQLGAYQPC